LTVVGQRNDQLPAGAPASIRQLLPADPRSVARARRLTGSTLSTWGLAEEELLGIAGLLVSELVTNAVRHADGGEIEIVLRQASDCVWLEVGDPNSRAPLIRNASPDDEGGRGLALVNALSGDWGSRTTPGGKVVWVRLDLPAQPAETVPLH
jgi:anti-sigma regulatory factor (Ser/Thr protein kinase)